MLHILGKGKTGDSHFSVIDNSVILHMRAASILQIRDPVYHASLTIAFVMSWLVGHH